MRVLVCGDRNWTEAAPVSRELSALAQKHGPFVVVEGGARGADAIGRAAATMMGFRVETFSANWPKHGRAAGPLRNRDMLDTKPDLVLAFHADLSRSKGTRDCVEEARRRGIPVQVVTA